MPGEAPPSAFPLSNTPRARWRTVWNPECPAKTGQRRHFVGRGVFDIEGMVWALITQLRTRASGRTGGRVLLTKGSYWSSTACEKSATNIYEASRTRGADRGSHAERARVPHLDGRQRFLAHGSLRSSRRARRFGSRGVLAPHRGERSRSAARRGRRAQHHRTLSTSEEQVSSRAQRADLHRSSPHRRVAARVVHGQDGRVHRLWSGARARKPTICCHSEGRRAFSDSRKNDLCRGTCAGTKPQRRSARCNV